MKKIFDEINDLRQVINDIDDEKYKNILSAISGVVNDMALKVEEIIVKQEAIEENMEYIGDDLTDMREEMFEEVSFDDLENLEDEYEEIFWRREKEHFLHLTDHRYGCACDGAWSL